MDTAGNGSSTATVEQAVALCQENKGTGGLYSKL